MRPRPLLEGRFFKLGYVTQNLEAAMARFADRYGVPRFVVADSRNLARWEGQQVRAAMAFRGDVLVELIEPLGEPGLFVDALPKGGDVRLHHLAYMMATSAWTTLRDDLAAHGLSIAFETSPEFPLQVIYADTRAELGHFVEFVHQNEEADALFASVPRY
jgi:hypothetical protein